MVWKRMVLEIGMGTDIRGADSTKAAVRLTIVPSEGPVHIAQEGEALSNDVTLLPAVAGGSTRSISVCGERGDRKRFRAAYGNVVVATATCVVSHSTEELESITARVVWTNQGLLCENW